MSQSNPKQGGANAADDVEASLEDFISQANKSFQEPVEGWSLNTDEVELIDPKDLTPARPSKIAAAVKPAAVGGRRTVAMGSNALLEPAAPPVVDKTEVVAPPTRSSKADKKAEPPKAKKASTTRGAKPAESSDPQEGGE